MSESLIAKLTHEDTMLANMEKFIAAACEERATVQLDSTTESLELDLHEANGDRDDLAAAPWYAIGSSLGLNTVTLASEEQGSARLPVPIGSRLGHYVVLGVLGRGGMGMVLEAYDESLERPVAIKLLHSDTAAHEVQRLRREALALAKLSHPHVVQVYEVGQVDGRWFIVMELVKGQTLRGWQREGHGWRQSVEAYLQAGRGLAAAHAVGLVHRDFKPDNCIIDEHGRVRVLDFGLVHQSTESLEVDAESGESNDHIDRASVSMVPITRQGTVMGTPGYMAPEQLGGRETDARSDQFAFCVSLYEALHGERPYEDRPMAGRIPKRGERPARSVPKGLRVPTKLRTVLKRGLAADPGARWPSMEALLTELQQLVAPRRVLRTAIWSVGVAVGLGLLGVGLAYQSSRGQLCSGAQTRMDGIWDDARRQAVQVAILETGRSYASDTWDRVGPQLDAYVDAWTTIHGEVCEATSVRGEQSQEAMDLRMRCLDQRRTALRATVDMLADSDATVVQHAVKLVTGLPSLSRCDELDWLQQQNRRVPPPGDPVVATKVEAQRTGLAQFEAMYRAGHYAETLAQVRAAVLRAEALDYPPLLAETLSWRGRLKNKTGQYAKAEQDLRQAHTLATEHHQDSVALDTAQELTLVVGRQLERHAEGRQWGEMVALPLAQRSGEPTDVARSLNNLGAVFHGQGEYEEATHYHQRALRILEQDLGPDHPAVASCLDNLGVVFEARGEYEEAKRHYQRALEIREKTLGANHPDVANSLNNLGAVHGIRAEHEEATRHHRRALDIKEQALGPEHPEVAMILNNLGVVSYGQGKYEEATRYHRRALAIREKALGFEHPLTAMSLNNLGNVFLDQEEYEEAKPYHQRALAIREKVLGSEHPLTAMSLNNLGIVFEARGEYEEATRHYQRALEIWDETLGPDNLNVGSCLNNLGSVLGKLGKYEEATRHYQRALKILETSLGAAHPHVAHPLVGLANVMLEAGEPVSARTYADRARSIREAAAVGPELRAEAWFVLARALWSDQSARRRARALAERARDALVERGFEHESLDEVVAWLAMHHVK